MEIFKDIKSYEGRYQVSNYGNVRSLNRTIIYSNGTKVRYEGKIISQFTKSNGYLQATLNEHSKNKKFYVHRLVAIAFLHNDDPDHKKEINHIDENKKNNHVDNLEWVTSSQNKRHNDLHIRRVLNTDFKAIGNMHKKPIIATSVETNEEYYFDSANDAAKEFGFTRQTIGKVCMGKLKTHKNYKFKFAEKIKKEELNEG